MFLEMKEKRKGKGEKIRQGKLWLRVDVDLEQLLKLKWIPG